MIERWGTASTRFKERRRGYFGFTWKKVSLFATWHERRQRDCAVLYLALREELEVISLLFAGEYSPVLVADFENGPQKAVTVYLEIAGMS